MKLVTTAGSASSLLRKYRRFSAFRAKWSNLRQKRHPTLKLWTGKHYSPTHAFCFCLSMDHTHHCTSLFSDCTFTLDTQKLQRKYVQLQRALHPDNFSQKSEVSVGYILNYYQFISVEILLSSSLWLGSLLCMSFDLLSVQQQQQQQGDYAFLPI